MATTSTNSATTRASPPYAWRRRSTARAPGYFQAISRTLAEWPPVEAIAVRRHGGAIRFARIAVGGVAPVPLRLERVENALRALHPYDEFHIAIKGLKQP